MADRVTRLEALSYIYIIIIRYILPVASPLLMSIVRGRFNNFCFFPSSLLPAAGLFNKLQPSVMLKALVSPFLSTMPFHLTGLKSILINK